MHDHPDAPAGGKPGVFYLDASGGAGADPRAYRTAERMAREAVGRMEAVRQAKRCGARIAETRPARTIVRFDFFGEPVAVGFPDGEVFDPAGAREIPVWERILLLHYICCDASRQNLTELVGFEQVPSGGFYFDAFRRRAHRPLAEAFGAEPARLIEAGRSLGGKPEDIGDAAVRLPVLPRVPVVAVVHREDEEFAAEAKILFESDIIGYFSTEDIAVLGGLCAGRLIQADRELRAGGGA